LHKLYDELAEALEHYIDDIAERAVQLGGEAAGTMRMAAAHSQLPEYPAGAFGELATVQALAERYALAAKHTRADIDVATEAGDQTTADLLIEVTRGLDKHLWFLEAHLR
ncbi:MAG: DNA starvation/stationary phase protection protein Dps, partial [Thermoflexales bacterium]|nr:DNA starvation/stationary phase protection protein Dps [Thermoflexales bacterium]